MLYKGRETVFCTSVTRMISLTPFFFVVLLAAVENAVIPTGDMDTRILGGEEASITEFPSMAYLFWRRTIDGFGNLCGATIISERWVLTAAHCVRGAPVSNITLRVGSANRDNGGSLHQALRIITHQEYISNKENDKIIDSQNDIAVVEVEEPFPLDNLTIKTARLAPQDEDIRPGSVVTVAGWGETEGGQQSYNLLKANLEIISREVCKKRMGTITIDRRNLCATNSEGKRTCPGDSGGPVFLNGEVIGVNVISTKCYRSDHPNVSTSVGYFRTWIKQNTGI